MRQTSFHLTEHKYAIILPLSARQATHTVSASCSLLCEGLVNGWKISLPLLPVLGSFFVQRV